VKFNKFYNTIRGLLFDVGTYHDNRLFGCSNSVIGQLWLPLVDG